MKLWLMTKFALRRLWHAKALAVAWWAGAVIAIALVVNVPLFSESASLQVMRGELAGQADGRPPFAIHLYRLWDPSVRETGQDYAQYRAVREFLAGADAHIGLPQTDLIGRGESPAFAVARWDNASQSYQDLRGVRYRVGFADDFLDHVELVEGRLPEAADVAAGETLPVLEVLASELETARSSLVVGEQYRLTESWLGLPSKGPDAEPAEILVRVVGLWRARDPGTPYWFNAPEQWTGLLMLPESVYAGHVAPRLRFPLGFGSWYAIFDDRPLRAGQVGELIDSIGRLIGDSSRLMPGVRSDLYNPLKPLEVFAPRYRSLMLSLLLFNVPIVAAMIYALVTISTLVVSAHRDEVAMLRSRGASRVQVLGIHLVESGLVALAAMPPGLLLAETITRLMGQAVSFLAFADRPPLEVALAPQHLLLAAAGAGLMVLVTIPAGWRLGRDTIVSYRAERAREKDRPFWERAFLDVLLLVPAAYGFWQLRSSGQISVFQREVARGASIYQDPLMYLVPVLFIVAAAMLVVRLLPYLLALVFRLTRRFLGASLYLALSHLARHPRYYSGPLLLILLMVSLAIYTAALARTLDANLRDRVYYAAGADLVLLERPPRPQLVESALTDDEKAPAEGDFGDSMWGLPFEWHLALPGVEAATRVGRYGTDYRPLRDHGTVELLAIEPASFLNTGFLRPDFASLPIASLVRSLAEVQNGVLVPRQYLAANGLGMGDRLTIGVDASGRGALQELDFVVMGYYDYFPTVYPTERMMLIANLAYIADEIGGVSYFDVWLRTAPDARPEDIVAQVTEQYPIQVPTVISAQEQIQLAEQLPERTGFFGTLSAGFLGVGALSVVGYSLFAFLSLKRRHIQLGILRAVGLTQGSLGRYLVYEQFLTLAVALVSAISLGLLSAHAFIPLLEVGQTQRAQVPPYIIHMAWSDLALLLAVIGLTFVLALGIVGLVFSRQRITESIKLAEFQ